MLLSELIQLGRERETTRNFRTTTKVFYRKVFADKLSITQKEHYQADILGFRPELAFGVRKEDYNNEVMVKYEGVEYAVFRTYDNQLRGMVELYLTKETGKASEFTQKY